MNRREAINRTLLMTGATVSAPLYLSLLSGCKPSGSPTWSSNILDSEQVRTLSTVADLIFPTTDTPGASDVATAECVDLLLSECRSEKDQQLVVSSLAALNQQASDQHGKAFCNLAKEHQIDELRKFEAAALSSSDSTLRPGYLQLKGLIMLAYFTAEPIMKNQLNYAPIAGRFDGCVDLNVDDRVFVDNNV